MNKSFDESDSIDVNLLSIKNPDFIKYVNSLVKDTMLFNMYDRCKKMVGSSFINERFEQLNESRERAFMACFDKKVIGQIKIMKAENTIPYNGFSFYKIDYNGTIPERLENAYDDLKVLNDEAPRNKYVRGRKK